MSNRVKPSALFPTQTEFPESKKMVDNSDGNMAIYEFFDYLIRRGYVLARIDPATGRYRPTKFPGTVEHEVLLFRGVDRLAYAVESNRLRALYPHLADKYGVPREYELPEPGFDVPTVTAEASAPVGVTDGGDPDKMVSVTDVWRSGVTRSASLKAYRMKLARSRQLHPEITPKPKMLGSQTLYRLGDMVAWEAEYDRKAGLARSEAMRAVRGRDVPPSLPGAARQAGTGAAKAEDALVVLLNKIRGKGEEDVQEED